MTGQKPIQAFGRYEILRALGQGGMGTVYLARDTLLDRHVALKIPRFSAQTAAGIIERFYREARVAASIHHPNICPVHDVGQINGVHYFTMPFIEGTPLSDLVYEDEPWDPYQAVTLISKLATALSVLHARGLIHRDLKPGNILVQPGTESGGSLWSPPVPLGEPVLVDFGLARSVRDSSQRLTKEGEALGTPAYMAPEQVMGDPESQGPTTDVYSLGMMLYELLTGKLPFSGPINAIYGQILHAEPPLPSQIRPGLGPEANALCRKALAKDPQQRYQTMTEFAAGLQVWLRRLKPGVPPPLPRPSRTGRVKCASCTLELQLPATATPEQRFQCPRCKTPLSAGETNARHPSTLGGSTGPPTRTQPSLWDNSFARTATLDTRHRESPPEAPPPRTSHRTLLIAGGVCALVVPLALVVFLAMLFRTGTQPSKDSARPGGAVRGHTGTGDSADSAEALVKRGKAEFARHDYDAVIVTLTKALAKKELPEAYTYRGWARFHRDKMKEALEDCDRAIQLDDAFALAYAVRGWIQLQLDQREKAIADCNIALKHDPKLAVALAIRGLARANAQDFKRALEDCNKAVKLDPSPVMYMARGTVYLWQKKPTQANADCAEAIRLDSRYSLAHSVRASVYNLQQRYDDAIADSTEAIRLDAKNTNAYIARSFAYMGLRNWTKSLLDCNEAIRLAPNNAITHHNRGYVFYMMGKYQESLSDTNRAIQLNPRNSLAYCNRGNVYFAQGKTSKAINEYTRAIELSPKVPQYYQNRAKAYLSVLNLTKYNEDIATANKLLKEQRQGK